jgi:hypothetical protein
MRGRVGSITPGVRGDVLAEIAGEWVAGAMERLQAKGG